jgi:AraC-like DNA-binding protein
LAFYASSRWRGEEDEVTDLTRSSALMHYVEHARANGLDPEALLRRAGIPAAYLADRDLLFSFKRFALLLELSAAESDNPCFGLELGILQGIEVLGPIAYLVRNSATVGEALDDLMHYFHLQTRAARVRIEVHGGTALMAYDLNTATFGSARQAVELGCAVGDRMMRLFLGRRWHGQRTFFQHDRLGEPRRYAQLLGSSPRFNAEFSGCLFDAALLAMPIADADPALHELMAQQMELLDAGFRDELPDMVEALIRSELPDGDIALENLASRLAISGRSLQRYLNREGTSYQALLDKVRRDVAEHYLRDSTLSLTQIAALLAYRDLSNFSRAFLRWHGISPRQWRKQIAVSGLTRDLRGARSGRLQARSP